MARLCRVEATGGFFLLLAWMNYVDCELWVPMSLLACALHELGHLLVIRMLGGSIKCIRLTAIGAELVLERPLDYWQEGLSALAGPGTNLLLAIVCCFGEQWLRFAGLNLALALFNLIPAGRLDGGRVLYCALALLAGADFAECVRKRLDWICIAVIFTTGVMLSRQGNYTLLLAALWLMTVRVRQNNWVKRGIGTCQRGRKQVK